MMLNYVIAYYVYSMQEKFNKFPTYNLKTVENFNLQFLTKYEFEVSV